MTGNHQPAVTELMNLETVASHLISVSVIVTDIQASF